MTDFDKEIRELEAQVRSLKSAKAEAEEKAKREAERAVDAQKAKDKQMHAAAADIGEGMIYLKRGFSRIMSEEDFELISNLLLNEKMIPLCFDLVEVCKEPFFRPIVKSLFDKVYDDDESSDVVQADKPHITITSKNISEDEVEDIIQSFIDSLGD